MSYVCLADLLLVNPSAPNVGDFFVKLMEKLSSIEMSGILFISLCRTPAFIDGLFYVIEHETEYPFAQRQACANVLRELLIKSGQKVFEQVDFSKPLPNMLSAIHDKLHDFAKNHVEPLCNILINMDGKTYVNHIYHRHHLIIMSIIVIWHRDHRRSLLTSSCSEQQELKLQSYTVKRPFGFYRLMLTDILSDLVICAPEVLDRLPPAIWRVLSSWFLEYR